MDRLENILGEVDMERSYERLTQRERKVISLKGKQRCLAPLFPERIIRDEGVILQVKYAG